MSLDHWVAVFSASISFAGLLLVVLQLRDNNRQRQSESLVEILDINRELLSLGFSHPQLFAILEDAKNADPVWERRYLQLWLNNFSLVHSYLTHSMLEGELRENLERDVADFMTMENIRKHWQRYGKFYPTSFRKYVDEILKKHEPSPPATAHVKSGR
jgi:hypothetical protein